MILKEGLLGKMGCVIFYFCVAQTTTLLTVAIYVQGLREITQENDALLCFDEVMTGFR